jgi:hypothetical protein
MNEQTFLRKGFERDLSKFYSKTLRVMIED